jgi:hypothetical protein
VALLEKMDALIIEGTNDMSESGYLIALALAYKKPILYLTEKGVQVNKNLQHLRQDKTAASYFSIQTYLDSTLLPTLSEFIGNVEQGGGREVPNIKFTLRITPRIERYLKWRTHNTKLSKADFLRGMIEKMIDDDDAFKKFLEQERKG